MKKCYAKIRWVSGVTWTMRADDYGHVIHCVTETLRNIDLQVAPLKRIELYTEVYNNDGLIEQKFVEYFYEW